MRTLVLSLHARLVGAEDNFPAIFTRSATDPAFILRITLPRWAFTVISLMPSSPPTCLFNFPETTNVMTSRSRRLSDPWRSRSSRISASWPSALRLRSMAFRMAPNMTPSPNGLVRNSTAPAFMAWTDIGTAPWPVMKMMGMSVRSAAMRRCSSSPLRPGSETSSTRQLGASTRGRARNSCAVASSSGCQPALRISNSSDSRTEMSSSTTNTMGVVCDMGDSLDSGYAECGVEGPQQSFLAEWLEQALDRAPFEHEGADRLIPGRGNEHDRNLLATARQLLVQILSGHARHRDVEDQASGLLEITRRQEFFRRRKRFGLKAELSEQVW